MHPDVPRDRVDHLLVPQPYDPIAAKFAELSCHCGQPARGKTDAAGVVPAHWCRQCSPEHCQLRGYLIRNGAGQHLRAQRS